MVKCYLQKAWVEFHVMLGIMAILYHHIKSFLVTDGILLVDNWLIYASIFSFIVQC